jgi:hypothetical protein
MQEAPVVVLEGGEVVIIDGRFRVVGIGLKHVITVFDAAIVVLDGCGSVVSVYSTDVVLKQQLFFPFGNLASVREAAVRRIRFPTYCDVRTWFN